MGLLWCSVAELRNYERAHVLVFTALEQIDVVASKTEGGGRTDVLEDRGVND